MFLPLCQRRRIDCSLSSLDWSMSTVHKAQGALVTAVGLGVLVPSAADACGVGQARVTQLFRIERGLRPLPQFPTQPCIQRLAKALPGPIEPLGRQVPHRRLLEQPFRAAAATLAVHRRA